MYRILAKSQLQTAWQQQIDLFLFDFGILINHLPSCLSFYIYILVSKAFRQACRRLVWKIIGKNFNDVRETRDEEQNEKGTRRERQESVAVSTIMS